MWLRVRANIFREKSTSFGRVQSPKLVLPHIIGVATAALLHLLIYLWHISGTKFRCINTHMHYMVHYSLWPWLHDHIYRTSSNAQALISYMASKPWRLNETGNLFKAWCLFLTVISKVWWTHDVRKLWHTYVVFWALPPGDHWPQQRWPLFALR